MWRRWTSEYLRALREWHRLKYGNAESSLAVGDVVIIKSVERNRNCWPLSIIEELIIGRDQVVRGAKLRVGKSVLERPVQHLYPLELVCDRTPPPDKPTLLNPGAPTFRPRRDAAAAADLRIQDTIRLDNEPWENLNKTELGTFISFRSGKYWLWLVSLFCLSFFVNCVTFRETKFP